ncbi:MAG TPA: hypothetical protein VKN99_11845 [Polyangia bacterium]|nr:hypothetical protein [Polyangia bacterium]
MWLNPVSWLAGAYGVQCLVRGTADLVRDRRISRHEPTPIQKVRGGLLLVRGRVRAEGGTLQEAPLSGTPCVLAFSRIADLEGTIVARASGVSFAVEDATGRARVLVEEGLCEVAVQRLWRRSVPESELDARAQAMLRPRYTVQERGRRERTVELCEWMVFPGDEVYVLAHAHLEVDARGQASGFREPPARAVLRGTGRHALVVADADRPSLRRAALRDVGKGAASIAAAAIGFAIW